ncbi:uncharacterized protein LOC144127372 [Amblyomma americanum]
MANASAIPGDGPSSAVSALSLRLPLFSPADPQLWLAQVNSQFTIGCNTTHEKKFHHVAASLPPEISAEVRDLLINSYATAPFDTLAAELIKRTAVSEHRRLQQLISSEELVDRKPTQSLRRLQQLLGDKATTFDQAFLLEVFLQRLPSSVRLVLVPAQGLSLEKLAQLADSVMHVSCYTISLDAVSAADSRYSTFGRELLAMYISVRQFKHLLEGRQFYIVTDHKRLIFVIKSGRGLDNSPADALSRVTALTSAAPPRNLDFAALEKAQQHASKVMDLCQNPRSLVLREILLPSCPVPII